jgi:DNA adenine methylase
MGRNPKYHKPIKEDFNTVLQAVADENMPEKSFTAKPFVKWVGGKRSILKELLDRIPENYTTYNEPFLGGGALFFALNPKRAYLSDINFYLVITYRAIKGDVDRLIKNLKRHKRNHNLEYFKNARIRLSKEQDPVKVASLFIYLNKTCYNGLYRVNKSGSFNVPMGKYEDPAIVDEDNLRSCSEFLKNTNIQQHTFAHIKPKKGEFYYLDPPYHQTFSGYDGSGFGDYEHSMLAQFCRDIDAKGGYFMLSNSDTPFVRELYKGYNIEVVSASRFISCKANNRNKQNELIIRNYA